MEPFAACLPDSRVVGYPTAAYAYGDLVGYVRARLPTGPFAIVAESFSGPVAVELAAGRPPGLQALVLAASFVRAPLPYWVSWLPLLRCAWLVRMVLTGWDAPLSLVAHVQEAVTSVPRQVLRERIRQVLTCDVTEAYRSCPVPILCLWATHDRLLGERVRRELSTRATRMAPVRSPHLLLQRQPALAARVVQAFYSSLSLSLSFLGGGGGGGTGQ